jgi:putative SOS response-associated peptidase YedK
MTSLPSSLLTRIKEVGQVHPKAMPVILTTEEEILTTEEEIEIWMTAPTPAALKLQRPLPDGTLQIVAKGAKQDVPLDWRPGKVVRNSLWQ